MTKPKRSWYDDWTSADVKALREKMRKTQVELARALTVDPMTISRLERGKTRHINYKLRGKLNNLVGLKDRYAY